MDLIYKILPCWDAIKSTTNSNIPTAEIQISCDHNKFVCLFVWMFGQMLLISIYIIVHTRALGKF